MKAGWRESGEDAKVTVLMDDVDGVDELDRPVVHIVHVVHFVHESPL